MAIFDFLNSQQTGTQNVTTSIDPQIKQAYLSNLNFADSVASRPYEQYGGPRIAGFSGDQNQAFSNTRQAAQGPKSFLSGNVSQYMNPYTSQVIDQTMGDLNRQKTMDMQGLSARAVNQGAFGGSRQAIAEQELNRNYADQFARTSAQLRNQGFDTAANMLNTDINRNLVANQSLLNQGNQQQAQVQRNFDLANQDFQNQFNYPVQQLGIRQSALGANIPNTGQIQSTPLYQNQAGNILGAGMAIDKFIGNKDNPNPIGSFLGGVGTSLGNTAINYFDDLFN